MTAPLSLELRIALERLVYLQRIRELVQAAFGPGSPKDRLLNSEVTHHVAERLDREFSPRLARDVIQAMRHAGWRHVTIARQTRWKGMRRL